MRKNSWISLIIGCLVPFGLFAQNGDQTKPLQAPGTSTSQKVDCSKLSPDERSFADQLAQANQVLFCVKFTSEMRSSAMEKSGQMGSDGALITSDRAVEQVAKANNIFGPAAPARQGGACPAK